MPLENMPSHVRFADKNSTYAEEFTPLPAPALVVTNMDKEVLPLCQPRRDIHVRFLELPDLNKIPVEPPIP